MNPNKTLERPESPEMPKVISIHEYELKPDAAAVAFERAIHDAQRHGLLGLTGLVEHYFLKGLKGMRQGAYAAVWVFESREVWEALWGTLESPRQPAEYPKAWRVWEDEILAPFLSGHPDTIRFTSYEEL
jgi:hypothetical protein